MEASIFLEELDFLGSLRLCYRGIFKIDFAIIETRFTMCQLEEGMAGDIQEIAGYSGVGKTWTT